MTTSVFIVHSNATDGHDDEFNDWYDNEHLGDIVAVPGIERARRYVLATEANRALRDHGFVPLEEFAYLAIYEIEGDPEAAITAMNAAVDAGMHISATLAEKVYATVYTPSAEWVSGPGAAAGEDALTG